MCTTTASCEVWTRRSCLRRPWDPWTRYSPSGCPAVRKGPGRRDPSSVAQVPALCAEGNNFHCNHRGRARWGAQALKTASCSSSGNLRPEVMQLRLRARDQGLGSFKSRAWPFAVFCFAVCPGSQSGCCGSRGPGGLDQCRCQSILPRGLQPKGRRELHCCWSPRSDSHLPSLARFEGSWFSLLQTAVSTRLLGEATFLSATVQLGDCEALLMGYAQPPQPQGPVDVPKAGRAAVLWASVLLVLSTLT